MCLANTNGDIKPVTDFSLIVHRSLAIENSARIRLVENIFMNALERSSYGWHSPKSHHHEIKVAHQNNGTIIRLVAAAGMFIKATNSTSYDGL